MNKNIIALGAIMFLASNILARALVEALPRVFTLGVLKSATAALLAVIFTADGAWLADAIAKRNR